MAFLLASFHEFTLFLKIVLWIAIPLIIVSFVITTILHYRQKKKNALLAEQHPDLPAENEVDISLVSRLQKEVIHYRRRIRELQHALSFAKDVPPEALKSLNVPTQPVDEIADYASPLAAAESLTIREADDTELREPLIPLTAPLTTNAGLATTAASDLLNDIVPAGASGNSTNISAGVNATHSTDLPAQHTSPLSRECLQDIVEEQKAHVTFLQQQLEARIKAFHELEYQFRDKIANLEKMTLAYEHVRHQLDDTEAAADRMRIEKDGLAAQVARLEDRLAELQAQHTRALKLFDTPGIDSKDLIHPLGSLGKTTSKS